MKMLPEGMPRPKTAAREQKKKVFAMYGYLYYTMFTEEEREKDARGAEISSILIVMSGTLSLANMFVLSERLVELAAKRRKKFERNNPGKKYDKPTLPRDKEEQTILYSLVDFDLRSLIKIIEEGEAIDLRLNEENKDGLTVLDSLIIRYVRNLKMNADGGLARNDNLSKEAKSRLEVAIRLLIDKGAKCHPHLMRRFDARLISDKCAEDYTYEVLENALILEPFRDKNSFNITNIDELEEHARKLREQFVVRSLQHNVYVIKDGKKVKFMQWFVGQAIEFNVNAQHVAHIVARVRGTHLHWDAESSKDIENYVIKYAKKYKKPVEWLVEFYDAIKDEGIVPEAGARLEAIVEKFKEKNSEVSSADFNKFFQDINKDIQSLITKEPGTDTNTDEQIDNVEQDATKLTKNIKKASKQIIAALEQEIAHINEKVKDTEERVRLITELTSQILGNFTEDVKEELKKEGTYKRVYEVLERENLSASDITTILPNSGHTRGEAQTTVEKESPKSEKAKPVKLSFEAAVKLEDSLQRRAYFADFGNLGEITASLQEYIYLNKEELESDEKEKINDLEDKLRLFKKNRSDKAKNDLEHSINVFIAAVTANNASYYYQQLGYSVIIDVFGGGKLLERYKEKGGEVSITKKQYDTAIAEFIYANADNKDKEVKKLIKELIGVFRDKKQDKDKTTDRFCSFDITCGYGNRAQGGKKGNSENSIAQFLEVEGAGFDTLQRALLAGNFELAKELVKLGFVVNQKPVHGIKTTDILSFIQDEREDLESSIDDFNVLAKLTDSKDTESNASILADILKYDDKKLALQSGVFLRLADEIRKVTKRLDESPAKGFIVGNKSLHTVKDSPAENQSTESSPRKSDAS